MIGKWTTTEITTLRAMMSNGKRYADVATILDRSVGSVEAKARALGINPMPARARKYKATLCWECANATNSGCMWSKYFRPVTGWTAKQGSIKSGGKDLTTFTVCECPEFVEG